MRGDNPSFELLSDTKKKRDVSRLVTFVLTQSYMT